MIVVDDLVVRRGARTVIDGVSLALRPGEVTGITGPNGAGKSTLLEAMSGALAPARGTVLLDGHAVRDLPGRDRARQIAVLAQRPDVPFAFSAADVVAMGRHPHGDDPAAERVWVARALAAVDLEHASAAPVERLSGGEQKRVQLARFLAQLSLGETGRVALFDEPTESLDLRHQHATMHFAERLARHGLGVMVVQHDVTLLAQYAARVVVIAGGKVVADGPPREALTPSVLRDVFGVEAAIGAAPWHAEAPWIFVRRETSHPDDDAASASSDEPA